MGSLDDESPTDLPADPSAVPHRAADDRNARPPRRSQGVVDGRRFDGVSGAAVWRDQREEQGPLESPPSGFNGAGQPIEHHVPVLFELCGLFVGINRHLEGGPPSIPCVA